MFLFCVCVCVGAADAKRARVQHTPYNNKNHNVDDEPMPSQTLFLYTK